MSKNELPLNQTQKVWENIVKEGKRINLELDLEVYRKLLNIIYEGEFYYWILDIPSAKVEYASPNVYDILGYTQDEFTLDLFFQIIHPNDVSFFLNFETKVGEFFNSLDAKRVFNYKVRYDFRLRKKNGDYLQILHQVITIQTTENGGVLKTLGIHSDISHLKTQRNPELSFIGLNGEPSFINVEVTTVFPPTKGLLTKQEKVILKLLVEGKQSAEIAQILSVSKHTILNHRRNILTKTASSTTAELIAKSMKEGWV
jgi:DNA-binding CsgD family transcriptional regulator